MQRSFHLRAAERGASSEAPLLGSLSCGVPSVGGGPRAALPATACPAQRASSLRCESLVIACRHADAPFAWRSEHPHTGVMRAALFHSSNASRIDATRFTPVRRFQSVLQPHQFSIQSCCICLLFVLTSTIFHSFGAPLNIPYHAEQALPHFSSFLFT